MYQWYYHQSVECAVLHPDWPRMDQSSLSVQQATAYVQTLLVIQKCRSHRIPDTAAPIAQVRPAVCVTELSERLLLPLTQQLSVAMDATAPTLGSSLEWIEAAWKFLDPETSVYRADMQAVLYDVNEAIKAVSRSAADRAIVQKAGIAGRIVASKLRSIDH